MALSPPNPSGGIYNTYLELWWPVSTQWDAVTVKRIILLKSAYFLEHTWCIFNKSPVFIFI